MTSMTTFWTRVRNADSVVHALAANPALNPVFRDDYGTIFLMDVEGNEIDAQSVLRGIIGDDGRGVVYSSPLDVEKTESHIQRWMNGSLAKAAEKLLTLLSQGA